METLIKLQTKLGKLQTKLNSFVAMKMKKQIINTVLEILKVESLIDNYQQNQIKEEQTKMNHKYIVIKDDKIYITSPYNGEFVTALKEQIIWKQRKWDGESKSWVVDNNPENLEIINNLLAEYYVESTEWVTKRITGKVSATAKRTYLNNVFIDGCALYNLGYGQLRDGATFEVIRVDQDEFTRGDSRHAFDKEFDITVKCRKNAVLKGNADFVDDEIDF
ncbi:MAG TPA: hypothetical protein V6C58_09045 [Allocoleopsis sp.]